MAGTTPPCLHILFNGQRHQFPGFLFALWLHQGPEDLPVADCLKILILGALLWPWMLKKWKASMTAEKNVLFYKQLPQWDCQCPYLRPGFVQLNFSLAKVILPFVSEATHACCPNLPRSGSGP